MVSEPRDSLVTSSDCCSRQYLSTDGCYMQEEVISYVRRRSNAFSRGKSRFRGVSGREGRWETRIGTFSSLKNVSPSAMRQPCAI